MKAFISALPFMKIREATKRPNSPVGFRAWFEKNVVKLIDSPGSIVKLFAGAIMAAGDRKRIPHLGDMA
jgi:hypothetical protein